MIRQAAKLCGGLGTRLGPLTARTPKPLLPIARASIGNPSLLLMDEPLEGLAPVVVDGLLAGLDRLKREDDLALPLVEQHARRAFG